MKNWNGFFSILCIAILCCTMISCGGAKNIVSNAPIVPKIDLSHWKVTIPTPREKDGMPMEFSPPEISNYAQIEALKEFMYPDSTDGSIVFYAYPLSSTANSKYSRSELREQMIPGNNNANWKFEDNAYMKVTMSVPQVTRDSKGKGHRVIIAQIHGKLTKEQQKLIGQKDTNAPPVLKIYFQDGRIQVKTKKRLLANMSEKELLVTKNWVDDKGYTFNKMVGKNKFTLEVIVSKDRLEVVLNGNERAVYDNDSIKDYGIFNNYFKTGNYLTTRDHGAHARVKIYDLEVRH